MQHFKYLIIGGGIAGTTAAETIRKTDHEGSMAIVSDEPHPLYSRVLLSKPTFVRGEQSIDSVWLKKPEWYSENHIEFIGGVSATLLDGVGKKVAISNGEEYEYEKLLLATGSHSRKLTISGAEKKGVYYLRGLDDTKAIMEALKTKKKALIVGGGCVSFEIAEVLRSLNIDTTFILREKYFAEPVLSFGEGMMVEKTLIDHGVCLVKEMEIIEVLGADEVSGVILRNGDTLTCDMILAMIGVVYPIEWLRSSGIILNRGIVSNEYLETSIPDVWTAGDIAEYNDIALKETFHCGNWMNSRAHGEVAGLGMVGKRTAYHLVTFQMSHGFGELIGFTGDTRALPERKVIFRANPEKNTLVRILIQDNVVIGATLINCVSELGLLTKLIEKGTDISQKHSELADPSFDLKTLLV